MAKTTTATTRIITIGDVRNLERTLNMTHYNCKANLKHRNIPFKGCTNFPEPTVDLAQSRAYMFNNLIDLKKLLNELDLGEKVDTSTTDYDAPF